MSINFIVGRPGSGKSYEAVRYHVIPNLEKGRKVVTNLPLNLDHFEKIYGPEILDLIEVKEDVFDKVHGVIKPFSSASDFINDDFRNDDNQGALFIIDECHFQYPRTGRTKKASSDLTECLEYFSMHRHYGHDILLMTQSSGKLNKDLLDMIEIMYKVSKHSAAGSDKSYTQSVYDGAVGRPAKNTSNLRTYDKKIFPFYKSHTMSDNSVKEAKASDVKPLWKQPTIVLGFLLMVIGIPMSILSVKDMLMGKGKNEVVKTNHSTAASIPDPEQMARLSNTKILAKKSDDSFRPFSNMTFSISGSSESSYRDERGKWVPQYEIYFSGLTSSKTTVDLKLRDFYMAGYEVFVLGDCLVRLEYKDFKQMVYCEGHKEESDNVMANVFDGAKSAIN